MAFGFEMADDSITDETGRARDGYLLTRLW